MKPNELKTDTNYFVCQSDVKLLEEPGKEESSNVKNHLLLGDWLKYLGETGKFEKDHYAKVCTRGDCGWLKTDEFGEQRGLEVNFVDVGQGDGCHIVTPDDKVIIIDAGKKEHMNWFLTWRYNLRNRKEEEKPFEIDYVVMSHPDWDHYGGFKYLFENKKLSFSKVYHNGIVERPKSEDNNIPGVGYLETLGGNCVDDNNRKYLCDYVDTDTRLDQLLDDNPETKMRLLSTFRALKSRESEKKVSVDVLGVDMDTLDEKKYFEDFKDGEQFSLQILAPIREKFKEKNQLLTTLRVFGNDDGKTKNGHSVIFKARYNQLTLLLGGDLNSESQKFLMESYKNPKDLFKADVAKACHHGSADLHDEFVRLVNASATVISSGDNESYSHPRADALGVYGKHGRGERPLIFSTELARSTREFTDCKKVKDNPETMIRNVAVYGMITLRALKDKVIIAQKLEQPKKSKKWDIYELCRSEPLVYCPKRC